MFEQQVTRINHCTQISREETQHGRGAINARCKRFTSISYANMTYHLWKLWKVQELEVDYAFVRL